MNWKEISELQELHIKNTVAKLSPEERKSFVAAMKVLMFLNNMVIGFLVFAILFYGMAQLAGYELHVTGTSHCCLPCDTVNRSCNLSALSLLEEIPAHDASEHEYYHADDEGI